MLFHPKIIIYDFMFEQVVSKKRVADHGEVFTMESEVNAMLDMVKQETERIDSRFLESACGTGNFLTVVLERKLSIVETRYKESQLEYECSAVLAISSIYGIDILEDNVKKCRDRLYDIFSLRYNRLFLEKIKDTCLESIKYILAKNIVSGNALTLKSTSKNQSHIVLPEWSLVKKNMLKRRDFNFRDLVENDHRNLPLIADEGDKFFIPTPVKEYPLKHFLDISNVDK